MATQDGDDVRRTERLGLKRKLTGPPRLLLLGKTWTRSGGEDDASEKRSAAAAESKAELIGTSRGHCHHVSRRCRWWSRFSSVIVCIRRKKNKEVEESLEEQQSDGSVQPEGALQETNTASPKNTEETSERRSEEKKTAPDARRPHKHNESVSSFQKNLHKFFFRGRKRRSSGVRRENTETKDEEAPHSFDGLQSDRTDLPEDGAAAGRPDQSGASEDDLKDTTETIPTAGEVAEVTAVLVEVANINTNEVPVSVEVADITASVTTVSVEVADVTASVSTVSVEVADFTVDEVPVSFDVASSEVFCDSAEVVLNDQRSASSVSSEERTEQTASESLQPSANGPSIRIELCPPDEDEDEDEEEECWGGSSSSQNHLLLLLGFDHSEQQLLQTARSLVRAALNAAVDQLSRERQSDAACVHREPPGCRDHA